MKYTLLAAWCLLAAPVMAQDSSTYFRRLDQGPYIFHVGRYPLSLEETTKVEECFLVEEWKDQRKVVVTALEYGRPTGAKVSKVAYQFENDSLLSTTAYDSKGQVAQKRFWQIGSPAKDGPSNVVYLLEGEKLTYSYEIDSEGWPVSIPITKEAGLLAKETVYIRDQNHMVVERNFVDSNKKLVPKYKGGSVAIIRTKRDEFNNVTEETFFDANARPATWEGTHRRVNQYDQTGTVIKKEQFGLDGQPLEPTGRKQN